MTERDALFSAIVTEAATATPEELRALSQCQRAVSAISGFDRAYLTPITPWRMLEAFCPEFTKKYPGTLNE